MNRRTFLKLTAFGITGTAMNLWDSASEGASGKSASVMTVTGEVSADKLGAVLPHEHVMVDFIGADKISRDRYDVDEVFRVVLPYLEKVRKLGCRTLVECTPEYIGRDPLLLRRLSEASGMHILTNTGLYGASGHRFLPPYAYTDSPEQLAGRWIREWEKGIDGTGIRPGFIKTGMDAEPADVDMKLAKAAGLTHLKTGLAIASHTPSGKAARAQIELLRGMGVKASVFIWVHAQAEADMSVHLWAAKQGAWVEFDGIAPQTVDRHVQLVLNMKKENLLHRVLISQDAGWYNVGEPGGGSFRSFETLFTEFLPALRKAGLSEDSIQQLVTANPQQAFRIGK